MPGVKLNLDRLRHEARARGWITDRQLADGLGVSAANVSRIFNAEQGPGVVFIAAALIAMPDLDFADIFEITGAQPGTDAT